LSFDSIRASIEKCVATGESLYGETNRGLDLRDRFGSKPDSVSTN